MANITYTSTEKVVGLKKDLRFLKEMKSKLNKLVNRNNKMLKEYTRKSDLVLEELQRDINLQHLLSVTDKIVEIQHEIQLSRQKQYDQAKEYSIAQNLDIDVVKNNMKMYNTRRINKEEVGSK